MATHLNLKEIERKAFRSTFQDGLMDIFYGLMVMCMSFFLYHPAPGYSPMNILLMVLTFSVAYGLFAAGKKYITLPRMGQVRFGVMRKKKNRTLAMILGAFVLIQIVLVAFTALGWPSPEGSPRLSDILRDLANILPARLVVASIGSLIVGISLILSAYFSDFTRGYYIAILMALAVFLMIYLNQPAYSLLIGGIILLPGLVLLVRFITKYPLQREDASHG